MNLLRHCSSLQETGLVGGKGTGVRKKAPPLRGSSAQSQSHGLHSQAWSVCQRHGGPRAAITPDMERPKGNRGCRGARGTAGGGGQPGPLRPRGLSPPFLVPDTSFLGLHQRLALLSGSSREGRVSVSPAVETKQGELLFDPALQSSHLSQCPNF